MGAVFLSYNSLTMIPHHKGGMSFWQQEEERSFCYLCAVHMQIAGILFEEFLYKREEG